MTSSTRRRPARAALAGMTTLLLVLLAGCSSSSNDSADEAPAAANDDGAGADSAGEDADYAQEPAAGDGEAGAESDLSNVPEGRMIARDAWLTIAVEDVEEAARQVRAQAVAADGWVVSEQVEPDHSPDVYDGFAEIVISVPSTALDGTLADLGPVGEVTSSTMTSEDVTSQHTDTTARIETLEASITRLRGLMEDTGGIEEIVALERELAQREADLDALRALAESLEGDVERSSITISLEESDPEEPAPTPDEERTGFTGGLQSGWEAFVNTVGFLLTALGALLPFLIVAAIIGIPVLWWRRRRTARQGQTEHQPSRTAASAGRDAEEADGDEPGED